jgi:hypothetical protein
MLDKCINWILLNKFGYFTITDLKGAVVGRSEKTSEDIDNLVNHFTAITDTLNAGTYILHGQKDVNSSASKMSYSFVVGGGASVSGIGFAQSNDFQNLQQQMFTMQLDHQSKLNDLKIEALKKEMLQSKKSNKGGDYDMISKVAGIVENISKLSGQPTTTQPTAQVGTTNANTPEEASGINLEIIAGVLGDEELAKTIKNLAIMAKTNPMQLKQFVNMLNS